MEIDYSSPMFILVAVAVVAVIVIAIIAYAVMRKKRSARLKERFGTEYALAVAEQGSKNKAEVKLAERQTHVEKLTLHGRSEKCLAFGVRCLALLAACLVAVGTRRTR